MNCVPLTSGEKPVEVNWVELTLTDDSGKGTFHTAFVTNHPLVEQNVGGLPSILPGLPGSTPLHIPR